LALGNFGRATWFFFNRFARHGVGDKFRFAIGQRWIG